MITRNDIINAISMCVGYDPMHSPKMSEAIIMAWSDHFEDYPHISRERLLRAVKTYYKIPSRSFPQPADISTIARAEINDANMRAPLLPNADGSPVTKEQREHHMEEIRKILAKQSAKWSIPQDL